MILNEEQRYALRCLPSVHDLAAEVRKSFDGIDSPTHAESVFVAQSAITQRRLAIERSDPDHRDLVAVARDQLRSGIGRVINGTGVVIHTNLGRAPLSPRAAAAVADVAAGYVDLEMDLDSGRRGKRAQATSQLLAELTGAEDALIVNNGAAAVLLSVAALAGGDNPTLVSRGHAVEIGGGFRIPEVVAQAQSRIIEVGTTNKTRVDDYSEVLERENAIILRVHQSNFRTVGFVEQPEIEEVCKLGAVVVDDLGSGALLERPGLFDDEPSVRRSVKAGADAVCFSGDKLVGGPQAGLIVGRSDAVEKCRQHPLARAVRVDRMTLTALDETLCLYRDPDRAMREIPVLAMLTASPSDLNERARTIADQVNGTVVESTAFVGGGTLPLLELSGPAVALPGEPGSAENLATKLRGGSPPLIARIHRDQVLVDPRTIRSCELDAAIEAIIAACR